MSAANPPPGAQAHPSGGGPTDVPSRAGAESASSAERADRLDGADQASQLDGTDQVDQSDAVTRPAADGRGGDLRHPGFAEPSGDQIGDELDSASPGEPTESVNGAGAADEEEPVVPRWWHSQPLGLWWLLPIGLAASSWVLWAGNLRVFGYSVTGTLALAAVVRLVLPRDSVGGLMVRSRAWDVVILLGLATALAVVTWTLDLG